MTRILSGLVLLSGIVEALAGISLLVLGRSHPLITRLPDGIGAAFRSGSAPVNFLVYFLGLTCLLAALFHAVVWRWLQKEREGVYTLLIFYGSFAVVGGVLLFLSFRPSGLGWVFLLGDSLRGALLVIVSSVTAASPSTLSQLGLPSGTVSGRATRGEDRRRRSRPRRSEGVKRSSRPATTGAVAQAAAEREPRSRRDSDRRERRPRREERSSGARRPRGSGRRDAEIRSDVRAEAPFAQADAPPERRPSRRRERSTSRREDSRPRREDSRPRREDSRPGREPPALRREDRASRGEESAPRRRSAPSRSPREDPASHPAQTGPTHGAVRPPWTPGVSVPREDETPDHGLGERQEIVAGRQRKKGRYSTGALFRPPRQRRSRQPLWGDAGDAPKRKWGWPEDQAREESSRPEPPEAAPESEEVAAGPVADVPDRRDREPRAVRTSQSEVDNDRAEESD